MKTIYVHPNEQKDVRAAVAEVCALLLAGGARALLPDSFRDGAPENIPRLPVEEAVKQADFAVCLGGDGTILRLSGPAARAGTPILGVNLGHVGFMTELERDEIPLLSRLLDGSYAVDERMMLRVTVLRNRRAVFGCDALNDAAIVRGGPPFHAVQIDVESDGARAASFRGDGIVLATPTGSTAYSLSAGGPIVEPSSEIVVLTPICAHGFQPGSFVFPARRRLSVRAGCEHDAALSVSCDGDRNFPLLPGDQVVVERSPLSTRLLRVKGRSFYHILQQKLSFSRNDFGRDVP